MCDKIIEILDLPETNTITLYELDTIFSNERI